VEGEKWSCASSLGKIKNYSRLLRFWTMIV
jgi:hypothetical protein